VVYSGGGSKRGTPGRIRTVRDRGEEELTRDQEMTDLHTVAKRGGKKPHENVPKKGSAQSPTLGGKNA